MLPTASGFRPAIDDAAFTALLLYDWIPEDQSIYRGVEKLAPGSYATLDPDGKFVVASEMMKDRKEAAEQHVAGRRELTFEGAETDKSPKAAHPERAKKVAKSSPRASL